MDEGRNYPQAVEAAQLAIRRVDITLRQNIDAQIERAKKKVEELESTKERMTASGILDMRIDDIQNAMRG